MIRLSDGTTTLDLGADLYWEDEAWSPVEQTAARSITGALILQAGLRRGGRPITLRPEDDDSAWMTRAAVDQLQKWASTPGLQLTLTLAGTARRVVFRHQDGAIEAAPVRHCSDVLPDDAYCVTLRFQEV